MARLGYVTVRSDELKRLKNRIKELESQVAELEQDSHWLRCLEQAGVDSWEGISEAQEISAAYTMEE